MEHTSDLSRHGSYFSLNVSKSSSMEFLFSIAVTFHAIDTLKTKFPQTNRSTTKISAEKLKTFQTGVKITCNSIN